MKKITSRLTRRVERVGKCIASKKRSSDGAVGLAAWASRVLLVGGDVNGDGGWDGEEGIHWCDMKVANATGENFIDFEAIFIRSTSPPRSQPAKLVVCMAESFEWIHGDLAQKVLNYPADNFRVLIRKSVSGQPLTTRCEGINKRHQWGIITRNRVDVDRICHWVRYNKRDHNKVGGPIVFPIIFTGQDILIHFHLQ